MIFDLLPYAKGYRKLGRGLGQGLAWLGEFSPQTPVGRYDIDGEKVFALVQSYDAAPASGKRYESHHKYIDIQYVASGSEIIYYAPEGILTPVTSYDHDKDFTLYADPPQATPLLLSPGSFAIFFPHDGHKPGCLNGDPSRVSKVVIKVQVGS